MSRIAICANTSWYIWNFRKSTISALQKAGYEVIVLAPWHDKYSAALVNIGCEVRSIYLDPAGKSIIKDLFTMLSIAYRFYVSRPSLVLNFTPKPNIYSTLVATLFKVKSINNVSGLGEVFVEKSLATHLVRLLYKFSQRYAQFIFFQNADDMKTFEALKIAENVQKDILPGSGVNIGLFSPLDRSDKLTAGKTRFVFASRLLFQKGVLEYVDAAKFIKNKYRDMVCFDIYGVFVDGERGVGIEAMREWLNSGVIDYFGTSDEMHNILKTYDCFVLPSYYREGVPRSSLEALASGLAVITTNQVGCKDVVREGENGYFVEPKSVDSLINAIEKYIHSSEDKKKEMALNSRRLAENKFDEGIVIGKYLEKIEKINLSATPISS